MVAAFDALSMRLLGICCASFSSGLGELTFLQLSTRYHPPSVAGHSVGCVSRIVPFIVDTKPTHIEDTSPPALAPPGWSVHSYGGSYGD